MSSYAVEVTYSSGVAFRVVTPNQKEFVIRALKELGLTPTELGNKLGKKNGYNAVNAWTTDRPSNFRRISYEDTMTILEMCDWLKMGSEQPTLRLAAREQPANELAELRATQSRMLADQKRMIAYLESLTASVEKLVRGIGDQPGEQQQQHD